MEQKKQKYIVINPETKIKQYKLEQHKKLYLNLKLNDISIDHEYKHVKYLGLYMDIYLNFEFHINYIHKHGRNLFMKVINRFGNAKSILAKWIPQIFKQYVLPKLFYGIEFWTLTHKDYTNKIKILYNDIIRFSTGSERSVPLPLQTRDLKWNSFENEINSKYAILFSRLIASPNSNILSHEIHNKFWNKWINIRNSTDSNNFIIEDSIFEEFNTNTINNNYNIHGIKPSEIYIDGEIIYNDYNCNWEFKDNYDLFDDDFTPYTNINRHNKNTLLHPFDIYFNAAKSLNSTDYICMKNMDYKDIPKRLMYPLKPLDLPSNLFTYHTDENNNKISFDKNWFNNFIITNNLNPKSVLLNFSDGSEKDQIGGAGVISVIGDEYDKINLNDIRNDKYSKPKMIDKNRFSYIYGAKSIGLRASIEHCELHGTIKGLNIDLENFKDLVSINMAVFTDILCIIDSDTVVNWIGGNYKIKTQSVMDKVETIYNLATLFDIDYNTNIHCIWVKAHNNEIGNECADDLAKLAMLNLYKTKDWKHEQYLYSTNEWTNYSNTALKKEIKRKSFYNTLKDWNKYKNKKLNEKYNKSDNWNKTLIKNQINWNINYHYVYKYERNIISYPNYRILNGFRYGHNKLQAHSKWKIKKNCDYCNSNKLETIIHFIFECNSYNNIRILFINSINSIYYDYYNKDFNNISQNQQLYFILYPFQKELNNINIKNDKNKKKELINKRINTLNILLNYINNTNRFKDSYHIKKYFTF